MSDEKARYDGSVLEKCLLGNMKCYFVENHLFLLNSEGIDERKKILESSGIVDSLGYAVVWKPDITIGRVDKEFIEGKEDNPLGFDLSSYDIGTSVESEGIKTLCFVDGEIHGYEQRILRESKNKDEYLSRWCLQERFRQEHNFKL